MFMPTYASVNNAVDTYDQQAWKRKGELDKRRQSYDSALIKSYVMETSPNLRGEEKLVAIPEVSADLGWRVAPIEDGRMYTAEDNKGDLGLIEPISARHFVLHSKEKGLRIDATVQKAVNESTTVDSLWIAGQTFSTLWEVLIQDMMPERFIRLKFEYEGLFEGGSRFVDAVANKIIDDDDDFVVTERRSSTSTIVEYAEQLGGLMHNLNDVYPASKALKMLRIPAVGARGGYEFWSWGKVTHRSSSFRDGRERVFSVTRLYERTTKAIEETTWLQSERHNVGDYETFSLRGAPITFEFSQPLPMQTFNNFINVTFDRAQGPFRLMGNPIRLGEKKVHIYGIDLHLWQRLYVEVTPKRMVVILPQGTCGNTVHRLMTNIQRYLDPAVKCWIGDTSYADIIRRVLLNNEVEEDRINE